MHQTFTTLRRALPCGLSLLLLVPLTARVQASGPRVDALAAILPAVLAQADLKLQTKPVKDSRKPAAGQPKLQDRPGSPEKKAPATGGAKTSTTQNPPTADGSPAASEASRASMIDKLVAFIREYSMWILVCLGLALVGVFTWAYFSARGRSSEVEGAFAELGLGDTSASKTSSSSAARYSSSKIQVADVNDRLARGVTTTEVETDREYALVVDEEDLKMPPLPEEAGKPAAALAAGEVEAIEKLLAADDLEGAYREFERQIETSAHVQFREDLEKKLCERLIGAKKLDKAARVLEHHVATREASEILPETYFNLGYIHFMNRTLQKSRRFLRLFVDSETNPAFVARAKRILQRIEKSPSKN